MGRRPSDGALYVWPGNGSGSISSTTQLYSSGFAPSTYVQLFGWGDYSGDTKADVLAADETGVWLVTDQVLAS
jgi:hypothetical protein